MDNLFNLKQKFEKFDEDWRADLAKSFSSTNKKSAEKHAFWIDHEFLRADSDNISEAVYFYDWSL